MKSKYELNVLPRLEEIEAWARDGVAEEDMAHNVGVSYSRWREYKRTKEALQTALARGKNYVDNVVVVNSLLKSITGYDAIESRLIYKWVQDPTTGERVRILDSEEYKTKHIPPNPTAIEFWLTRRQREAWPGKASLEAQQETETNSGVVLLPAVIDDEEK